MAMTNQRSKLAAVQSLKLKLKIGGVKQTELSDAANIERGNLNRLLKSGGKGFSMDTVLRINAVLDTILTRRQGEISKLFEQIKTSNQ